MKREELKEKIYEICHYDNDCHDETVDELLSLIDEYTKPKTKKKSLEERKQVFFRKVLDEAQEVGVYTCDMVQDFIDYWTEHGDNDRKMRFEKQKSFGIKRRLATWKKNQKTYNNGNKPTTTQSRNATEDDINNYINS